MKIGRSITTQIAAHASLTKTHGVANAIQDTAPLITHAALTTGIHGVGDNHVASFIATGKLVNKIIWLPESVTVVTDLNRTTTLDWTDLDLTANTSENAKFAIFAVSVTIDSLTATASVTLGLRENGETPVSNPSFVVGGNRGDTAGVMGYPAFLIVALGAGEICEYKLDISGTIQVDSYIILLGYIE